MKTWYCVTSSFYNDGAVIANVTATREAEKMPESAFVSTAAADIYHEWFGSLQEARKYAAKAKLA